MLGEFKKFVMRGNVIDLAVGVIIIPVKATKCAFCTADLKAA